MNDSYLTKRINNKKNILLLSAGRRVELAQSFRLEMNAKSLDGKLYATEMKPDLSAACQVVDQSFKAPCVSDPSYIDFLLATCMAAQVGMVVPTIDTELMLLAKNRERFADNGIHIVISDVDLVNVCSDKRQTAILFEQLDIDIPKIYPRENIQFPCFAKPYDGSCSIGALAIREPQMLSAAVMADEKIIFMELIEDGFDEYTVDAYFDRFGELRCFVTRQRLETRAGEVSKGVTRKNHVYDYLLEKLIALKGARGCITLQLFNNAKTKRFAALEINPRFGGGYPLSYSAGAKYPGWLIDEYLLDRDVPFMDSWESNLMMLRYDAKVLVHGSV
jgi:carbamoyl-phosphate synthase large subunit